MCLPIFVFYENVRQFFKSWSTTTTTTTAVVTASRTVNKSWSNSKHSVARSDATAFLIAITVWRNRRISNCSTPPPPCNPKAAVGLNGEFNNDVADVDFVFDVVDFLPRLTEPPVALALSFCNVDVVFEDFGIFRPFMLGFWRSNFYEIADTKIPSILKKIQ
uniref:Uncharacterized protein n=1 Tax=Glossina pallidipes TaxID=7398 RepID=A0A1B0AGE1_GLOPL